MGLLDEKINKMKAEYTRNRPNGYCVKIGPGSQIMVYDFASKSYLTSRIPVLQLASKLSDGQYYVCLNCLNSLVPGAHEFLNDPILGTFCPDCTPVCLDHGDYMGLNRDGKPCCLQCLPCIRNYPSYIQPYK